VPVRKSLLEIIPAERIKADCTVVCATEAAAMPSTLISMLLALLMACTLNFLAPTAAFAALPPGNAITDPAAILRDSLPVQQADLQELQHRLEGTSNDLRARRWSSIQQACKRSIKLLDQKQDRIINDLPTEQQATAKQQIAVLQQELIKLGSLGESQDRDAFLDQRRQVLNSIGQLEALAITNFPYAIPEEFNELPRLLGRASVEIRTNKGNLTAVVDGYNAPLTAGAFIDLVQRGFYNGLPFNRAEDFYVLQTGDPVGPASGYIAQNSKTERQVPLEIMVPGEKIPQYNKTFEDLGLFKTTPVLPFATLGTLGWAHSDEALGDGSSQFFFFLYEAELTPAGLNLVDGRYAVFGYVVDGFDVLEELGVDDKIETITLLSGAENLQAHG
jgi:peptidylprolyl isomerase